MKFIQVQELSEMALLKVAVAVCNNFEDCVPDTPNKRAKMNMVYNHWNFILCRKCLNRIKEMVSHLLLPRDLENMVAALCKHVYREMCTWFRSLMEIHIKLTPDFLPRCLCLDQVDFRRYYVWKTIGIIDEKKTIENLIHDHRLDLQFRFVIACCFCFENDLRLLWFIMPEDSKTNIRNYTSTSLPLVSVWLKKLDGEVVCGIRIVLENFFRYRETVLDCFLSSVSLFQHFLQVVPSNQRKEIFNVVAHRITRCHQVVRYCFFQMNEEEQKVMFQNNPHAVLCSLLDWPWQRHFMKVAFVTFDFLHEGGFFIVMADLWCKIVGQWCDYDYIQILTEFWSHSPTHLKDYMRREKTVFMERLIYCLKMDYNLDDFH